MIPNNITIKISKISNSKSLFRTVMRERSTASAVREALKSRPVTAVSVSAEKHQQIDFRLIVR